MFIHPDRSPVPVHVVRVTESVEVPAVLAGTDRLIVAPRLRLWEPVVYVAFDARSGRSLYVGLTHDLDARRLRHETEARRGDPSTSGGSVVPVGSVALLNALWACVPVPPHHGRRLEEALRRILRPTLVPAWRGRLDARHEIALEAGGWTPEEAVRLVAAHRVGLG